MQLNTPAIKSILYLSPFFHKSTLTATGIMFWGCLTIHQITVNAVSQNINIWTQELSLSVWIKVVRKMPLIQPNFSFKKAFIVDEYFGICLYTTIMLCLQE